MATQPNSGSSGFDEFLYAIVVLLALKFGLPLVSKFCMPPVQQANHATPDYMDKIFADTRHATK